MDKQDYFKTPLICLFEADTVSMYVHMLMCIFHTFLIPTVMADATSHALHIWRAACQCHWHLLLVPCTMAEALTLEPAGLGLNLALPLDSWVTLSRLLYLPVPQFLSVKWGWLCLPIRVVGRRDKYVKRACHGVWHKVVLYGMFTCISWNLKIFGLIRNKSLNWSKRLSWYL